MQRFIPSALVVAMSLGLAACNKQAPQGEHVSINKNPYPSTYQPYESTELLIRMLPY